MSLKHRTKPLAKATLRLLLGALVGFSVSQWILSVANRKPQGEADVITVPLRQPDSSPTTPIRTDTKKSIAPLSISTVSPRGEKMLSQLRAFDTFSDDELAKFFDEFRLGTKLQKALLKEWARRRPSKMFDALHSSTTLTDDDKGDWYDIVLAEWIRKSPQEAIDQLAKIPESANSECHLALHHQLMQQGHVEEVLELESHTKMIWWAGPSPKIFLPWFQANQSKALEMVSKIPMDGLRQQYLNLMAAELASDDPAAAIREAAKLPERDQRAWIESIVGKTAESSFPDALALLADQVRDPELLAAARPAIIKWMDDDPQAALTWSQQNLIGQDRLDIIVDSLKNLAGKDWELATATAKDIENVSIKNSALSELLKARLENGSPMNRDELDHLVSDINDPLITAQMLDHTSYKLISRNPTLAKELAASPDPRIARRSLIEYLARRLSGEDYNNAVQWAESLPERNRRIAEKAMGR